MQKKNRIFMRVVAMLLCIVLITSCLVATIFARYVARDSASIDGVKLKNWGITIETGTHAKSVYEDSDGNTVVSTKASLGGAGKLIAPGTSGSLAWFHVFGSPEVDYNIDLNGSITIGTGYTNSVLTANEEPITYFPIVLYLVAYEVTYDGEEMILTRTTDTNDYGKVMNFAQSHLRTEGTKRNTLASTQARTDGTVACWTDVANIVKTFNGENNYDYMSINNAFDQNDMSGPIDRVYALEWCWPYKDGDSYPRSDEENFKQGTYQTREYDTQLGEKMREGAKTDAFNISVEMNVKVEQAAYVPPYTRSGNVITFGSYPQSQVTDSALITALNGEAASADTQWTSQMVKKTNREANDRYIYYVDVKNGKDKYRGVSLTSDKTNITWFKFEPVKWLVLAEDNGTALIISQQILELRLYQENDAGLYNVIPGTDIYFSSWEHSTIREWLNNTFYETVFTPKQRSIVNTVTNSNAPDTTKNRDNEYAKDSQTEDKIFFLTYQDHTTVYGKSESSPLRTAASYTDYTTIRHGDAYYNDSKYFTRSPEGASTVSAFNGYTNNWHPVFIGSNINGGVRPAMWITL